MFVCRILGKSSNGHWVVEDDTKEDVEEIKMDSNDTEGIYVIRTNVSDSTSLPKNSRS